MRRIRQLVPLLARGRDAVLLTGGTGTGRSCLRARCTTTDPAPSARSSRYNMAATPAELVESVFFGHTRGAFTGAQLDNTGLFEQAHGGTLLLDEVDGFRLALQPKLLRVTRVRQRVRRIGSSADREVDAGGYDQLDGSRRSHRAGRFRARTCSIACASSRSCRRRCAHRREDVPALARHILAGRNGRPGWRRRCPTCALDRLLAHDWPGNVRELRHALRSACVLAGTGPIPAGALAALAADGPASRPARRWRGRARFGRARAHPARCSI